MNEQRVLTLTVVIALWAGTGMADGLRAPTPVTAIQASDVAHWSGWLERGVQAQQWRLTRTESDPDLAGRSHRRYAQTLEGVPVFGAELVQQIDASGNTQTVFGTMYQGLSVGTTPTLTPADARQAVAAVVGAAGCPAGEPRLTIVVLDSGSYLTYVLWGRRFSPPSLMRYFVDARSGAIVFSYEDLKTATPVVGVGIGTWGDRKKLATREYDGQFLAEDRLRPTAMTTYDMGFDEWAYNFMNLTGREASDGDNEWTDGAVVDAHVYAGWTYDYLFQRFGRRGIDNHDAPLRSFIHVVHNYVNAFWDDVTMSMTYGDGGTLKEFPGVRFVPLSAGLDVVAHELMHGVTSKTWDGIYANESGALNEAFSDIFGTSVEFFWQGPGNGRLMADYWMGEDLTDKFNPEAYSIRSLSNPGLFGDPDHYSRRYVGPADAAHDWGGVHINSGIANQAFYLLVEGGTNRTSGLRVTGLGAANREKAERIFFRGFTLSLTPSATFSAARRATIQAASDLYGASGNEVQQVQAAWTAVGVE